KALSDGGTQVGKKLKLLRVLSCGSDGPMHVVSVRLRQVYGILPVSTLERAGLIMVTVFADPRRQLARGSTWVRSVEDDWGRSGSSVWTALVANYFHDPQLSNMGESTRSALAIDAVLPSSYRNGLAAGV